MKILLPIDGSDVSLQAARYAIGMARQGLACSVVLANVQEGAHLYELVLGADAQAIDGASAAAGVHALEAAAQLLDQAGLAYEREVARGDPAHTIVEIGERYGCDLIIMGAQGRGPLRSALLGSVSNEVLHAAGGPVMIVKAEPDREPDEATQAEPEGGA